MRDRLAHMLKLHSPDFIILLEAHTCAVKSLQVIRRLGRAWTGLFEPGSGVSGGLLVAWKEHSASITLLSADSQFMHVVISFCNFSFLLTCVYASTIPSVRRKLWDNLSRLNLRDIPWIVAGDLNTLLSQCDKKGGTPYRPTPSTESLRRMIDIQGLLDLIPCNSHFS